MFKGKFIDNLPKIYGTYTGGFLVFIILMAIAEQAGMTAKTIGILFVLYFLIQARLLKLLMSQCMKIYVKDGLFD